MPTRAPAPCTSPQCPELQPCPVHGKHASRAYNQARGTVTQQGYGWRWQRARAAWLSLYPLCAACLTADLVVAAVAVDHVVEWRQHAGGFWDRTNWASLCLSCHSRKTRFEHQPTSAADLVAFQLVERDGMQRQRAEQSAAPMVG